MMIWWIDYLAFAINFKMAIRAFFFVLQSCSLLAFLGPLFTPLSERGALFLDPFGRPAYSLPFSADVAAFFSLFADPA